MNLFDTDTGPSITSTNARCGRCPLWKSCRSPMMPATGEGRKGILVVAEAPGQEEDRIGVQLVGEAGQCLRGALRQLGIDLDQDCRKINSVGCRPPSNRTPTPQEITACRPMVLAEMNKNTTKVVLLLGNSSVKSVIGLGWKRKLEGVTRWRGWTIPDQTFRRWLVPTYHPSYVLRTANQMEGGLVRSTFLRDLKKAIDIKDTPLPDYRGDLAKIRIFPDPDDALSYLRSVQFDLTAIDFECTGIKPQKEGHRIVSCALSLSEHNAVSFPVGEHKGIREFLVNLLKNPKITKIASNMKYEMAWAREILGVESVGWVWDTMLAAHIQDNRGDISSLKFQAYARFGTPDYEEGVYKALHSMSEDGANAFNQIDTIQLEVLLKYNGMDAMLEHRLALVQAQEMGVEL